MTPPDMRDIDRFTLLARLEPDAKQHAAAALRWRSYGAGEIVMGPDEDSGDVFFLSTGQIFAVHWTADGREIIFSAIPETGYFGELMAIDGVRRSLSVYARTPASLAIMPGGIFRELMDSSPAFRRAVLIDLARKVRDLTERNCQLTTYSVIDRVKAFILRFAAEASRLQPGALLPELPTHAEIAAHIGANREAVSRAFSTLRRQKIITGSGRGLQISDPEALMTPFGSDEDQADSGHPHHLPAAAVR
ncbi:cAMP-binding domain of CRP or a regulatory subunit of cAMP-dependent protein kinases [Paracoccus alcaliphilus]|uniref:cAMP-binding domain of CRP or a regulatory subunit of cAMP-dependent protein kinases n=1 Tax=Paracoccus alcaliphilus TaxID=34002 RepID=A0A1H8F3X8_9RHOB|nr:Crp/Fnr family transcriptional regulator [Paracoccus alcaliphilus]WCR20386.1 Crp/Fnr family transcriptional regulator [Paracoccus alcaliphilus]SEN26124.1 cAMP-binding domain of CRP or a regulatory subunit of cAMP-dependent protein kinases [Paracoccus alcaliphilus]